MSNTPKLPVCMSMRNASRYIRECIDSILSQTFTDFELLIVDDDSTDGRVDIVRSYSDPNNCNCSTIGGPTSPTSTGIPSGLLSM